MWANTSVNTDADADARCSQGLEPCVKMTVTVDTVLAGLLEGSSNYILLEWRRESIILD